MKAMDFSKKLRSLIWQCLSTMSFSTLLKSSSFGYIVPQCGMKQSDPLSPYLFLLVFECFSRLISRVKHMDLLHNVKIVRNSFSISHLLYVDDIMIFLRANTREATNIQKLLDN